MSRELLREMISTIERVVGRDAVIERRPMQAGDVMRTFADLTRSRAELGYEPSTSFEEGVKRQWDWARGQGLV
jgi:UDP-glucuronate 4-epimerase